MGGLCQTFSDSANMMLRYRARCCLNECQLGGGVHITVSERCRRRSTHSGPAEFLPIDVIAHSRQALVVPVSAIQRAQAVVCFERGRARKRTDHSPPNSAARAALDPPRPSSEISLFGQDDGTVDLNPEISGGALQLRAAEQVVGTPASCLGACGRALPWSGASCECRRQLDRDQQGRPQSSTSRLCCRVVTWSPTWLRLGNSQSPERSPRFSAMPQELRGSGRSARTARAGRSSAGRQSSLAGRCRRDVCRKCAA